MKQDTIIIFQKPELYFFPYYKDIVFSPFGIPEKSFRYLIYKALYLLNLPCCSFFWGDWKKHIKDARRVIIFDFGYQKGMETYIKKRNPSCEVYLFFWNIITKNRKNHRLFSDKKAIYSTDKRDCARYHFRYNHMFYPYEFQKSYSKKQEKRLFFLGVDKGRAEKMAVLKKKLEQCGIRCDIRLKRDKTSHPEKEKEFPKETEFLYIEKGLSYKEYLKEVLQAGILLDINQEGQTAITMRVVESVFLSKKLITNNQDIASYPFYRENNILILPEHLEEVSVQKLEDFLEKPFLPYDEEIKREFSFEHWKNGFSKG